MHRTKLASDNPSVILAWKRKKKLNKTFVLQRRIYLIDPDGNESVGSHSRNGTEPCGFISV